MSRTVTLAGPVWEELRAAVKPHVSKDDTRPLLCGVNLIGDCGYLHVEACDSYTIIRATVDGTGLEGVDITLEDGAGFLSVKAKRQDDVLLTFAEDEVTVTVGATSSTFAEIVSENPYIDLDKLADVPEAVATETIVVDAPGHLAKLARFPKARGTTLTFHGSTRPVSFYTPGNASPTVSYRGLLMPMRTADDGESAWITTGGRA